MELLTSAGVMPVQGRPIGRALGLSLAVHAGLVVALAFLPARPPSLDTPIEVTIDVPADVLAPPEPQPPAVQADTPVPRHAEPPPRLRPAKTSVARPAAAAQGHAAPEAPPAVTPTPEEPPSPEITPAVAEPGQPDVAAVVVPPPSITAGATRSGGGNGGGSSGDAGTGSGRPGAGPGGGGDNRGPRRATAERYRDELLRTRIHSVFRYPSEARELELAGRVLVTVAIHRNGQLLDVKLAGRCPHAILCADGLRTLRAAAPFPPIPPELGESLVIEVPLTYAFE